MGLFGGDSSSTATNIGAADMARVLTGKGAVQTESGGFTISNSKITDSSRTTYDLTSGLKFGANSRIGNVTFTNSDPKANENLLKVLDTITASSAAQSGTFGNLVEKIGALVDSKTTDAVDAVAPTPAPNSFNWKFLAIAVAALGALWWLTQKS